MSLWNTRKRHRLRRVCESVQLQELAQRVDLDPATLSGYLSGKYSLSLDRIDQLCHAVGVDPQSLDRPVVVPQDLVILQSVKDGALKLKGRHYMLSGKPVRRKLLDGLIDEGFIQAESAHLSLTDEGAAVLNRTGAVLYTNNSEEDSE